MDEKKSYCTKQKKQVLDFFQHNPYQLYTAKQLIQNGELQIGEATIYRLLIKMTKEGFLKKVILENGHGFAYQYNPLRQCSNHFHLECLTCGKAVCMDCAYVSGLEQHVEHEHDFTVDNNKTVIYGFCKNCKHADKYV